ncbi:DUF4258 domain-containing protein [Pseudomonas sp. NPDC047961]
MQATHHCKARQAQRGIPLNMIDYVLAHGTQSRDKVVFGDREAKQRLAELDEERRMLMKLKDKGGVVVVADGDTVITTYNLSRRP